MKVRKTQNCKNKAKIRSSQELCLVEGDRLERDTKRASDQLVQYNGHICQNSLKYISKPRKCHFKKYAAVKLNKRKFLSPPPKLEYSYSPFFFLLPLSPPMDIMSHVFLKLLMICAQLYRWTYKTSFIVPSWGSLICFILTGHLPLS